MLKRSILASLILAVATLGQAIPREAPALNLLFPCKGRVTVVAFVITTCPPCKYFAREVMEPLSRSETVCMVAALVDNGSTAKFAQEQGLTFPVYRIERRHVLAFLGIGGDPQLAMPQIVVIDRRGGVQAQSAPGGSPKLLRRTEIEEIVRGLNTKQPSKL